jgi:hypothetical protein
MQFATQGSPTLNREYVVVLMGEIPQVTSDKSEELNEKYFIILIKKTVIKHKNDSAPLQLNILQNKEYKKTPNSFEIQSKILEWCCQKLNKDRNTNETAQH